MNHLQVVPQSVRSTESFLTERTSKRLFLLVVRCQVLFQHTLTSERFFAVQTSDRFRARVNSDVLAQRLLRREYSVAHRARSSHF